MKKINLLVLFTLAISLVSNGQNSNDSINLKKVWGGYQFFQNDKKLAMREVMDVMKSNEQAYKHIKSAQRNKTWATIIGGIGGFMVGWPLGTAIGGGDPNWTMAGIGAGLIVVSIPINQKFNKHSKNAVNIFNGNRPVTHYHNKTEVDLAIGGNKVGLRLKF